jgi:hypothetical protein
MKISTPVRSETPWSVNGMSTHFTLARCRPSLKWVRTVRECLTTPFKLKADQTRTDAENRDWYNKNKDKMQILANYCSCYRLVIPDELRELRAVSLRKPVNMRPILDIFVNLRYLELRIPDSEKIKKSEYENILRIAIQEGHPLEIISLTSHYHPGPFGGTYGREVEFDKKDQLGVFAKVKSLLCV